MSNAGIIQTPQNAETQPKKKGLAIASLVCGIIGSTVAFSTMSIPAVICGHIALRKVKRNPATHGAKGIAVAGLCLGYIGFVLALVNGIIRAITTQEVATALNGMGH
jgi:hypothetical protein